MFASSSYFNDTAPFDSANQYDGFAGDDLNTVPEQILTPIYIKV
jgi:hypothetical protein